MICRYLYCARFILLGVCTLSPFIIGAVNYDCQDLEDTRTFVWDKILDENQKDILGQNFEDKLKQLARTIAEHVYNLASEENKLPAEFDLEEYENILLTSIKNRA